MGSSNQFQNQTAIFGKKLQELWHNPSAVSALASLGLHGLLFLALPFLPYAAMKATEPEIQRSVDMVELSPEEQKRLPEFTTLAPIELPPIKDPPKTDNSGLFSLNTPPKAPSNSSSSFSDSFLAPPPTLPIFIPPLPPPSQIPSFTIQIPKTPPRTIPSQPAPTPQATQTPDPSPSAAPSETAPSVAVEPGPESPQPDAAAAQPSPTARTEEQIRQDLVARQQELRELYTYNPSGTSEGDANVAFTDWFYQQLGKDGEAFDKVKQEEVTVDYPRQACPLKQSRRAVVGVVIDAENKIVGEPKVLQSSGYRLFNQEALKVIESYEFNNSTGGEQTYLLGVKFEYSEDVCPPGLTPIVPAG